jgi:RND family efflux transporter MFP subunit
VREASRDLQVEAEVPNADGKLKPGMFAEGRVALAELDGVTVPTTAVRADGSTRKVYIVQSGRVEERLVDVGEIKDGSIQIRRGVNKGESIVVALSAEVVDGVKVK